MKAHPIGDKIFFNYIFKVVTTVEPFQCELLIPENSEAPSKIQDQILELANTVLFYESSSPSSIKYVDLLQIENEEKQKTQTYFAYIQRSKDSISILLSKYYHPRALKWPISFNTSLFLDLRSLQFLSNDLFEIRAKIPENPQKQFPNIDFIKSLDFSQKAEISILYQTFLSNFPPLYMFQFIYYLFNFYKIYVVSSKIEKLTDIVFAINSFFYPLQKDKFLIKTIPLISKDATVETLDKIEGPAIIGIPMTHMLTLGDFSPSTKYILFNVDIPYLILNSPPNESNSTTQNSKRVNSIKNLLLKEHRETLNVFYQFRDIFPTFHIQTKIAEFTVALIQFLLGIESDNSTEFLIALREVSKNSEYESFFKEGSLVAEFFTQLCHPYEYREFTRLYFPLESETPQITVPQLLTDFNIYKF